MAILNGYKSTKSDMGLGLGGNPRLSERPSGLTDSMDVVQNDKPAQYTKDDFKQMMQVEEGEI